MAFYLNYALRALRRSGQRTLLVIVSVAFGVMALVAMLLLSDMITDALLQGPRVIRGGDLYLERPGEDVMLSDSDVAQLAALQAAGRIDAYTLSARTFSMLIKPEGGTKTAFVMYGKGVEPEVYPLVGRLSMRAPEGATLADAIGPSGQIAVSRDLAADLGLSVGDVVLATDGMGGAPQRVVVGGVIEMVPDHMAKSVLYSLDTARLLANNQSVITSASLLVDQGLYDLAHDLESSGWEVIVTQDTENPPKKVRDVFNFGLKGAGMLALLVGGIGVSNTMQVVLARRTTEIAVLKTLGYRRWHLLLLFGLETVVIGIVGSLFGLVSAVLIARPLVHSMENAGIFLLDWRVDIRALISGGLAGVATAVIFGFYAILRASAVRPAALLRQFSTAPAWQRWLATVGVYGLLTLPFGVVSAFIMGSPLQGAGIIALGLAGFLGLGLVMGIALWLTGYLPMPRLRLLVLARNNLKRQRLRHVFALIALFAGVVAIGFSVATIRAAGEAVNERLASLEGPNLILFGRMDQDAAIQAQMDRLKGVRSMHVRYPAELASLDVWIDGAWQPLAVNWLDGRRYDEPAWGLELTGEPWGSVADGVYLPQELRTVYGGLQAGMRLRLENASGAAREMALAGFFTPDEDQHMGEVPRSAVISREATADLSRQQATVIFEGELEVSRLNAATRSLGNAIPGVMVISASDVRAVVQGMLLSLLSFVIAVAGLALVAGAVLIANAVGLAMIERRREIGVMKAVGYTSRHVLTALVLEHAQLGLLAGVSGTAAVAAGCFLLRKAQADIVLTLDALPGLAIILVCTGLAVVSVVSVAWRPTRVPPLVVLRDE